MPRPDDRLPQGIRRGFRFPFTSARRARQEVVDELDFHFDMAVRELEGAGHPPRKARELAEERFGDPGVWRERILTEDRAQARRARRHDRVGTIATELRRIVRGLVATPVFTLGVVLTLAIGIGANATMVGMVDRLLLRPPEGVVDASQVRRVWQRTTMLAQVRNVEYFSYPNYTDFRDRVPAFQSVAAYALRDVVSGEGVEAVPLQGALVTGSYFSTLGIRPLLGRLFVPDDAEPGSVGTLTVLSYALWQQHFGGRPDVVGESITLGGHPMTIIGVLPDNIGSLNLQRVDAWLPISAASRLGSGEGWEANRNNRWVRVVGRLAPGATAAELDQQLTSALLFDQRESGRSEEHIAEMDVMGTAWGIQAGAGPNEAASVTVAKLLAGMSAVLLLIACANVANLLLVKGMKRQREMAVRVALGVSSRRLVASALAESLALAAIGGSLALLVANWGGSIVRTVLLPEMVWPDRLLDGRVALITFAAILLTALLAGMAPALRSARVDVLPSLQGGSRGGGFQPSRLRSALLVVQAALCVLLLAGAGLFVRSLENARGLDLGFDPNQVLLVSLPLPSSTIPTDEWASTATTASEALGRVPGVLAVARTNSVPRWSTISYDISVPGLDSIPLDRGQPLFHAVSTDYFTVMDVELKQGRLFDASDSDANVLVVNETAARLLWPGEDAIGRCIRLGTGNTLPCHSIVGIVGDMLWEGVSEPAPMQVYGPERETSYSISMLVRVSAASAATPASLGRSLRIAAMQSDPRLAWAYVDPLNDIVAPDYRAWRLGATMFSVFGALALLLAVIGLYSVVSYVVAQRRHEMGVRLALGASRDAVARVVVKQGVSQIAVGVIVGVVAVLLLAGRLEGLLFGVGPRDPAVLLAAALALILAAALACLIPAVRAARVNPAEILRSD